MCKITEDIWRQFEKLVYAIIKDTLNLDDSNSILRSQKKETMVVMMEYSLYPLAEKN